MGKITLITGGSRSGKSALAQAMGEKTDGGKLFLATSPVTDSEMEVRIQRHINDRHEDGWETVEEQVAVADVIAKFSTHSVILVDCLTLWVNNLMYHAHQKGEQLTEDKISEKTNAIIEAASRYTGSIIFVTNEVGLGIVPENETARLYRDLVGRCNQAVAVAADNVYLVSCGIPLKLKGKKDESTF